MTEAKDNKYWNDDERYETLTLVTPRLDHRLHLCKKHKPKLRMLCICLKNTTATEHARKLFLTD